MCSALPEASTACNFCSLFAQLDLHSDAGEGYSSFSDSDSEAVGSGGGQGVQRLGAAVEVRAWDADAAAAADAAGGRRFWEPSLRDRAVDMASTFLCAQGQAIGRVLKSGTLRQHHPSAEGGVGDGGTLVRTRPTPQLLRAAPARYATHPLHTLFDRAPCMLEVVSAHHVFWKMRLLHLVCGSW